MKNKKLVVGFIVVIFGALLYVSRSYKDTDLSISSQDSTASKDVQSSIEFSVNDDVQASKSIDTLELTQNLETELISKEQRQKVVSQEEELTTMIHEYEGVRNDPMEREIHKRDMEDKLRTYSQDLLPIALDKINKNQSN